MSLSDTRLSHAGGEDVSALGHGHEAGALRTILDDLLARSVTLGASDLHLTVGIAPCVRINGSLRPLEDWGPLTSADSEALICSILTPVQQTQYDLEQELDLAYSLVGISR